MKSKMNYPRKNFGCSFDLNMSRIFVFGGDTSSNSSTSTIEQYTLETDEWILLTTYNTTSSSTVSPTNTSSSSTNTSSTSTTLSPGAPITLSFRRTKHNCVLDINTSNIYIFGGGGCSEIDNVCSNYRNLVEVFDTNSYSIKQDEALLLSGIKDSYSSFYWQYNSQSLSSQIGSWFDGIFAIGGRTEDVNATYIVQYRITNYDIINHDIKKWRLESVSYLIIIICSIILLIIVFGYIFKKIQRYTDERLYSVLIWLLYLSDIIFDFAFNGHLWELKNYGLASFGLGFILIRLIYNIGFQLRVGLSEWKQDITIRERVQEYLLWYMSPCCPFGDNEWLIYFLSILSGSSHGLIHLLNSNLFGLSIFNMGLVKRHMIEYNLTRLPSGLLCGNIPQGVIQLLYVLQWGSEDTTVLYAGLTTFISLCIGIVDIFIYKNSTVPVRKLMLDEDFTKPFFLIFKSDEITEKCKNLIHKPDDIIPALSNMIDVEPEYIEINLCQIIPKGIKISFVEYSGTKNVSEIISELSKQIQEGWFPKQLKSHWRLQQEPTIEIWDAQSMYEHKQLFTQDLVVNMKSLYNYGGNNSSGCCNKCWQLICVCSCCHQCCDLLRVSSMRR